MTADDVTDLITRLIDAQKTYTSLAFDEEEAGTPRAPATSDQIAALERQFGRALPPSFKTFLQVYNGFDEFHADGVLFGTEDYVAPWVARKIESITKNWQDVEPNPFAAKAIPIMMGPDIDHFVVLAFDRTTPAGAPLLVEYDSAAEVDTHDSVEALIEAELDTLNGMIDRQRNGADFE